MNRKGLTRSVTEKQEDFAQAEAEGKQFLRNWFHSGRARQAETARRTGIFPAALSKMANVEGYPIGLEYAILIEVGTDGAVPANLLCPSRADVLAKLLALRSGESK